MSRGWFVTGTDTSVGKTLVSAALINNLAKDGERVVGMKPVASGCHKTGSGLRNDDAEMLIAASNVDADYCDINPYAFEPAIAPHLAAQEEGIKIELENVFKHFELLSQKSDSIVVEGVGGWMAPLGHVITNEHLAKTLGLPVVLVVGLRLGCISHALLTARAIEAAGLGFGGWVANTIDPGMERIEENIATLGQRLAAPMLGRVPHLDRCDFRSISSYISVPQ
jgi:dethiobiotin synthetase